MTSFRNPPDIEPLSDLSWQRIENNVLETLDGEIELGLIQPAGAAPPVRRSYRTALAVGTVLAAAAAVALIVVLRGGDQTATKGEISRIVTEESPSQLSVGDSVLSVSPQSALLVSHEARGSVFVVIERGSARFAVAPRGPRPPFVVHAGAVRVEVVGTKFSVTRTGDSAAIAVEEGIVEITSGGDVFRVGPGGSWPPADRLTSDSVTAGDEAAAPSARRSPAHRERGDSARDETRTRAPREEARRDVDRPAPTAAERYAAAARLERTDPEAAIAIYKELSKLGGKWGATALFARASLEYHRGNTGAAQNLLEQYLEHHPNGVNAEDARDILRRLGP